MKHFSVFLASIFWIINTATAQPTRETVLFTEGWKFHKDDVPGGEKESLDDASWRIVNLPHDWSIEGPFSRQWASGTGFLPGGVGWYRKTFNVDKATAGKKVFIYFDGVYKNSEVWLNGHFLGKRPNGFIPFQYELTPYLKKGRNTIAVRVDHTKFADARFYTGSGIYRNVKGVVWVNGHNLGRYWSIGPQQTLSVPVEWLKKGKNEVVVLELLKTDRSTLSALEKPILNEVRTEEKVVLANKD